jgi:hypothetical protein
LIQDGAILLVINVSAESVEDASCPADDIAGRRGWRTLRRPSSRWVKAGEDAYIDVALNG